MTTMNLPGTGLRGALPHPRHLVKVHPHDGAHRVALRAAVSVTVPLLALWLSGHLSWAPYAVFGAFASLYGRAESHATRLVMQLQAGLALTVSVTIGASVASAPDRRWLSVVVVTGCAAVATVVSSRLRWHPGGPIFVVFGSAAVASNAAPASRIPVALAVAASAAAFAVLVGSAGRFHPAARRAARRSVPAVTSPASQPRPGWQLPQAARFGSAVLISGSAATLLGIGHPYWSMVSAVAALTGADATTQVARAIQRVAGTLAGVLIAAALLAPHLPALALIAVVAVLQGATELFVGRNYGLAVLFLTPLAITMGTLAQPAGAWPLLHDRTIETLLGAAVGVVITLAAHARSHRAAPRAQRQATGLEMAAITQR